MQVCAVDSTSISPTVLKQSNGSYLNHLVLSAAPNTYLAQNSRIRIATQVAPTCSSEAIKNTSRAARSKQIQKLGGAGKPQDADDPGNRNPIFSTVAGIT
jgi:hypothetical protein